MTTHALRREISTTFSFGSIRLLILALAVLALLGVIYMAQSTQATLTGQHVQELRDRRARLEREIDQLEYDIAVQSAPAKIAERARALGLHPATLSQTVYLQVKNYPVTSAKPVTLTHPPQIASDEPFITAWWNELLARIGLSSEVKPVEASP